MLLRLGNRAPLRRGRPICRQVRGGAGLYNAATRAQSCNHMDARASSDSQMLTVLVRQNYCLPPRTIPVGATLATHLT